MGDWFSRVESLAAAADLGVTVSATRNICRRTLPPDQGVARRKYGRLSDDVWFPAQLRF